MHVQSYHLTNFRPPKKIWPHTSFTCDRSIFFAVHMELWTAMRLNFRTVKVMLYETIRRNTALQCWNNVATIRNNIATMLQRRVTACTKNRCCKSSRVTSPLRLFRVNGRKFAWLPFWLSLSCCCLDIVNFLLSTKCKTGCYFLPILNQPQGVAKQWVQGEGRNGGDKIEKCLEMSHWEYCTSLALSVSQL